MKEVLRLDSGVLVTDGDVYRVEEESSFAGEGESWRCRLIDLALSLSDLRDIMEVVICVILLFRGKYNNRGRI